MCEPTIVYPKIKTKRQKAREAAKKEAAYQSNVKAQVEAFIRVVECGCLGLEPEEYVFINNELSKHGTPSLKMTEKQKNDWWKRLAPKLYKILKVGQKRFGWPKIPDHVELRMAHEKKVKL